MKLDTFARVTVALALATTSPVLGATPEQWRERSIYQLLTDRFARPDGSITAACNVADGNYCGGTWSGIIGQLDYIQNMGFTAIWISPITYNIPERTTYGYAYHGYWQEDLYRLNDHFGTADDLKALSKALHDRDMYLMVDVVTNHNGWNGSATTVDYARFYPFNNKIYYHNYCPISNYGNQTMVEDCWIGDPRVELPDLKTENRVVANGYASWIEELVSNYSIDGLRLDTAKYVSKTFLSNFNGAAGVFCTGEVFSGNAEFACGYQSSLDSVLNLPLYYPILDFLNSTSGTTASLLNVIGDLTTYCRDKSVLGTFTENHDLPRFASQTRDLALAKNALALTMSWDGIPIVYAGQEQHYAGYGDPGNREATWLAGYSRESELYNLIAILNQVRTWALAIDTHYAVYDIVAIYSTNKTIATKKGAHGKQIVSVFTNTGNSSSPYTLHLPHTGWKSGTSVVEALSCALLTVSHDGTLPVPMANGLPRVFISTKNAAGSGICNMTGTDLVATRTNIGIPGEATKDQKKSSGMIRGSRGKRTIAIAGAAAILAGAIG